MSRKRLAMKPITDLWWRYCRTNRENLCTIGDTKPYLSYS
jgi:hypothetical protein